MTATQATIFPPYPADRLLDHVARLMDSEKGRYRAEIMAALDRARLRALSTANHTIPEADRAGVHVRELDRELDELRAKLKRGEL
jgi:hypothetical protein